MEAQLIPHPTTADGPVRSIRVLIDEGEGQGLLLRYVVQGEIDRIRWPEAAAGGRADELWRHTCFEAFAPARGGYREYNLSSSGQWATYAFEGYRRGMRAAPETASVRGLEVREGEAVFDAWIELPGGDRGRLALSAVIETTAGEKSYWALAHPSDKPDFHHPDSFVLELP